MYPINNILNVNIPTIEILAIEQPFAKELFVFKGLLW